jgi:hypothetical protein
MPSYQFPVEAAQIALFVRAAGGADVDGSGRQLAELTVTTRNGAGEEVLTGYATARVDQIQGGRSTAARA